MAKFAELLQSALEKKGISQYQLAKMTGMFQSSVNRYCRGETEPKWIDVQRIAAALDLPFTAFAETLPPLPGAKKKKVK